MKKKNVFKKKVELDCKEDIILKKINHKNIVKLINVVKFKNYKVLYLQDFECNSISEYQPEQKNNFKLAENNSKIIIKQLLEGINYIHSKNIIHNDIHPDNILFNELTKKILIIDFDTSVVKKSFIPKTLGCNYYIAPEKVDGYKNKKKVNNKIDMYSIGCILHVLLTGKTIYFYSRSSQIDYKSDDGIYTDILVNYSEDSVDLLYKLLERNPDNRISTKDALNHNWFNN